VLKVLGHVLAGCEGFERATALLDRLNRLGLCAALISEGVDVADLHCGLNHLKVQLPRPLLCNWQEFMETQSAGKFGPVSHTFAQWQVEWGLNVLLSRWDNLVGDTLAKLLACVLLEQKVLLLGDAPRISTVAILLRALMWPFRWLHTFLSIPPSQDILKKIPLLEAVVPVVVSLTELPPCWGYKTHYELPIDIVTGVLRHDYVHIFPDFETTGGLKGKSIRLPAGRHTAFVKQVAQAKQKLRKLELDVEQVVKVVQECAEAEVWQLAELIRRYALCQVVEGRMEEALEVEVFMRWLANDGVAAGKGPETACFYETFFQTQLCNEFLYQELTAAKAACNKVES